MNITFVHIRVKLEKVDEFIKATSINVQNSINEAGAVRFDFYRQENEPTKFVLVEIYKTPGDAARHKETEHYKLWRETVGEFMEEPRVGIKYQNILPDDNNWR